MQFFRVHSRHLVDGRVEFRLVLACDGICGSTSSHKQPLVTNGYKKDHHHYRRRDVTT